MIRPPTFAQIGWYPNDETRLRAALERYVQAEPGEEPLDCFGVVSPHAGYRFSGHVAGALFARVRVPGQVVLLCVNHRGMGKPAAVWRSGAWRIPGADIPIDTPLADAILAGCPSLEADTAAHIEEHSGELQVPFLHFRNPAVRIVPITLRYLSAERAVALGEQLAAVLKQHAPDALVVASSDMNHFEDQQTTETKDQLAIDQVLAMNPTALHQTCANHEITMCGVVPSTVMLAAARVSGAHDARLIRHATSGDINGDFDAVVGYAGLAIVREQHRSTEP